MRVRDAVADDFPAIRSILIAAYPTAAEADLVERLRADGDAAIELVADDEGLIVGHVLFSPVEAPFRALALGPVAVLPQRQRQGIGSELISAGHWKALEAGWSAVFVLGEPDYYRRFGYDAALAAGFSSPYAGRWFMAKPLEERLPATGGEVRHAPAFAALED